MNFQNTNNGNSAGILARHLQKYLLIGILYLFAVTGVIFVSPRVIGQEAPHAAPSAPQAEKSEKKSHAMSPHAVEGASREELLTIIDKQRKLISALEARVKELEQSEKSAEGQERNKQ